MALKKSDEALLRSLTNGAKALSEFVRDADTIRAKFADQIAELEQEAQVVLRFDFVNDELVVTAEDRSQDKVATSFNTTGEKLLLRAQLNGVPVDVMVFRQGKKDPEPTLKLSNDQVANALAELAVLVRSMPVSMVDTGNAKWSLVPGELPAMVAAEKSDDNNADQDENGTVLTDVSGGDDQHAELSGDAMQSAIDAELSQMPADNPKPEAETLQEEEESALG